MRFINLFRNGTLHLMSGVCALVTKSELEYWGIDELLLEPCCALKYYPEIELCCKGNVHSTYLVNTFVRYAFY